MKLSGKTFNIVKHLAVRHTGLTSMVVIGYSDIDKTFRGAWDMKKIIGLVSAVAVFTSSAAFGASLSDVNGKVLVNAGKGFVPAAGGTELVVGSTVMVGEESFATIAYADCAVVLSKPAVHVVTENGCLAKAGDQGVFVAPTADIATPDAEVAAFPLPLIILVGAGVTTGILAVTKTGPFKKNKNGGGGVSAP